ncbi:hypothetical protein VPH35_006590 [Triticum aestivum]
MFSSLAPAAASKNLDGEGRGGSGPASPERLRHMHTDVAELLRGNTTPRRRRAKKPLPAAPEEERGHARYRCAFEEDGLAPPRMVWAKVAGTELRPPQRRVRRGGFARDALRCEALVGYVSALAVAPGDGADRLDHAIAAAQLHAFNRWRGKTVMVFAGRASRAATPKRTKRARGQDDGVADGGMVFSATPRARRATTPKRTRPTGQDDGAVGSAMVFSAMRASRSTTPRRTRARGQDGGDASAGNRIMTRCARAAAAADAAFVRNVFRGEASVEYHASAKGLTPHAGAELAVATAQPRAFAQWRGAATFVPDEYTATHDTTEAAAKAKAAIDAAAKMTRSTGGEDSAGDPAKWKVTSCISSREENSGCKDDVVDDDGTESEYSEALSHEMT